MDMMFIMNRPSTAQVAFVVSILLAGCVETRMTEIPENAVIVDARTRTEYSMNHLSCAKSLPWYAADDPEASEVLPSKSTPVVVYCLSGHRSVVARDRLEAAGYEVVLDGASMYSLRRLIADTQPDSTCIAFTEGQE